MTISIAQRFRPFSHSPGMSCLIPGTAFEVKGYPALIEVYKDNTCIRSIPLEIEGPLKQFTIFQDLERGCVSCCSELYTVHLLPNLEVVYKKNPGTLPVPFSERLSLGSHKKQEWEAIRKRMDFHAIFPLWHRLGLFYNETASGGLLQQCQEAIGSNAPETILPAFQKLFLTGMRNLLVPRLQDDEHQGILAEGRQVVKGNPLGILGEGARLIRSLFISHNREALSILPHLPPEFFAGRMIKIAFDGFFIDMEWTKKQIRRLNVHAFSDQSVLFVFRSPLKRFRMRENKKEKGKIYQCGDVVEIKSGALYLLDRFQK